MEEYEIVIGLEVHAELSTKTKIFCSCPASFGGEANTHCCPVCTAMPGALPVLNKKVIEYAVKAGLATNCVITKNSKNDRKNYYYPDLPKSYQISQYDMPLCQNGFIEIENDKANKKIGITRIHIEEDAGKLNHIEYSDDSLIDLNRAGVPLIEIVSEPDLRSAEEVDSYLKKIKLILEYIDVSDCKMQEGSLRADVNISVRKNGAKQYGTRTEMKNLNSFKAINRAINYESKRQIEEIKKGNKIIQETLRWDDLKEITYSMRDKEESHDYRYFPDPDLTFIRLTDEYINGIKNNLPELPEERKSRYIKNYKLPEYDAKFITSSKHLSDLFDEAIAICNNPKSVSNWIMSEISKIINENDIDYSEIPFSGEQLGELISFIDKDIISTSIAKKVLEDMYKTNKSPKQIIEEKGLVQITDEGAIKEIVIKVLEKNPKSVEDYKAGKDKALGFIVGQVMKESRGKANPGTVNKLILEELNKQ